MGERKKGRAGSSPACEMMKIFKRSKGEMKVKGGNLSLKLYLPNYSVTQKEIEKNKEEEGRGRGKRRRRRS